MAAKRRKKKKKKKNHMDPADVLSGKTGISALELIRMIHAVNPTARNIPKKEADRRYRLKSQLQSLLINRFGDSLIVEEEPGRPDIAGLKLRHFSEDACHAVVKELDDNARQWIYRHVSHAETQGHGDYPAGSDDGAEKLRTDIANRQTDAHSADKDSRLDALSVEELIRTGRKALEEYDYDMCGKCFTRAFEMAPDNVEIAVTLLEFLVDFMGAYDKAFQLFQSMSLKLKKNIVLEELAALALIRSGKEDIAVNMVKNASSPRAAEVYMLACRAAIDRSEADKAEEYLHTLKHGACDDFLQEINRLENDIHNLSIQGLEPEVQRMLAADKAGDLLEAADIASAILEKWPENMDARSIRRKFAGWKREKEIKRLLKNADRAAGEGRYYNEAEFLKKVIRLKGESVQKALRTRLNNTLQKAEEAERKSKISRILTLMEQNMTVEALTQYAALDQKLRAEILNHSDNKLFSVMEQLVMAWKNIKPARAARAVCDFVEAIDTVAQGGNIVAEARRLEPFADILRLLPDAKNFFRKAEEYLRTEKRNKAMELLDRAERYKKEGDIMQASDILRGVALEYLDERDRERLQNLSLSIAGTEKIRLLEHACEDARRQDNWIEARNIARRLIGAAEVKDRSAWREKEADFAARATAQWHLHKIDISGLPTSAFTDFNNSIYFFKEKTKTWLLSDHNRLIIKSGYGRWICLAIFSIQDQAFQEAIVFRAPVELSRCDMVVYDDELYLTDTSCRFIAVRIDRPEITQWQDMNGLISPESAEYVYCFPASGRMWADMSIFSTGLELMLVINTAKRIVDRKLKIDSIPVVLNRHGEALLASQPYDSPVINIYSPSGRLREKHRVRLDMQTFSCTMHPNGKDYVIAPFTMQCDEMHVTDPHENSEEEAPCMFLETVLADGSPGSIQEEIFTIPGAEGEAPHILCTSFNKGIIFLRCVDSSMFPNERLLAFRPEKNSWKLLYNAGIPRHTACFIDERSENVVLFSVGRQFAHACNLGEIPPENIVDYDDIIELGQDLPSFSLQFATCGEPEYLRQQAETFLKKLEGDADAALHLASSLRREKENPDRIIAFLIALRQKTMFKFYIEFQKFFFKKFPAHPYTLIKQAEDAASQKNWIEAISGLEDIDRENLDDELHCHICHILGISYINMHNPEKAIEYIEEGLTLRGGTCELDEMLEFARLSIGDHDQIELPHTWKIFDTVDNFLSEQDWMGAIHFIEHHCLVHQNNLQLLARLTKAWLNVEVLEGTPAWLCKIISLAHFCELHGSHFQGKTIILPKFIKVWSKSELLDLAKQAELILNG